MLATRGNYIPVVEALLAREPNVNIVDYNGLSALGIAAREGSEFFRIFCFSLDLILNESFKFKLFAYQFSYFFAYI